MVDLEKNKRHKKTTIAACIIAIAAAAAAIAAGSWLYSPGGFSPMIADSGSQTNGDQTVNAGNTSENSAGKDDSEDGTSYAGNEAAHSIGSESDAGDTQSGSVSTYITDSGETVSEAIAPVGAETDDWNLLLVNPWHLLPDDFTVELADIENGQQIDARAADDLEEMMADCRDAGYSPYICSSYREYSKQVTLFNNDVRKYMNQGYTEQEARDKTAESVAIPGTSEHEAGLALDIVDVGYQVLEESQENTETQKWLMEHCWDYGFILRYPKDKTDITGITYEPWHYRYVGRKVSQAMRESGECLEEYLGIYH